MPLTPGTRIGAYEVVALIGAGGMGEVYRARDAKLNRDVAIKVLPELFTADPDRLIRFRREAQVLASLNHPNIGQIYGLEDSGTTHALVLELVEGPTLQDRIDQGAIPLDDAIPIARQLADALECAHELGIIHRDLKPANIKVRPDGTVKVLDFGLAKAFEPAAASSPEMMNSPTLTARATLMGVILGTAAYMAPEQARGRAIDRRADIWAFGVVLFEMLTGKRAFEGDDISITLASVLKDDLDWRSLPDGLPRPVRRLLRRCLEKDPKKRLSSIGDARLELDEAGVPAEDPAPQPHAAVAPVPAWRRVLPWTIAASALMVAGGVLIAWAPWRAADAVSPVRLSSELGIPPALALAAVVAPAAVIAPDGRTVAVVADAGGRSMIHVRRLDHLQATSLVGTEGGFGPFFSPDGEWIGFFASGKLKKIAAAGGAAVTLSDAPGGRGGSWGEDGTIVFQPSSGASAPLHKVPAAGGTSTVLGDLADGEVTQRWPQILPGGKAVLYSGSGTTSAWDVGNIMVQPLAGGAPKVVLRGGFHARYLRSGHLIYMNQGTLFAVSFDLDRLEVTGNAAPILEGVGANSATGAVQFTVSDTGTLVYISGSAGGRDAPIHWMDAKGATTVLRGEPADWFYPRFSPDGQKLAITIGAGGSTDVWIHEAARDLTKLTFEPKRDFAPVWTPDGRRIAIASDRADGPPNLYWQRADGTGDTQRLTESPNPQTPSSFHRSGRYLAFHERHATTDNDILILPIEGDEKTGWKPGTPEIFLKTPAIEMAPVFSPDGRWIAYMSNESGAMEVYVRPFQGTAGKWKISTSNGLYPVWSPVANELFYLTLGAPRTIMVASYTADGESFRADKARPWSPGLVMAHAGDRPYDLHPDGRRFVIIKPPEQTAQSRDKAVFIFNFFDEVRRVASGAR
jgi:Tol biopolymer transport system component